MTTLKPDVYKKRDKLRHSSSTMRSLMLDSSMDFDNYFKIKQNQDETYKKWIFYDKLIKTINKKPNK